MGVTLLNSNRSHRTALFVDGNKLSAHEYAERAGRLIESLNGGQIKVDLFVVRDGQATRISSRADLAAPQPSSAFPHDALVAAARDAGYTQVLTSTQGA